MQQTQQQISSGLSLLCLVRLERDLCEKADMYCFWYKRGSKEK